MAQITQAITSLGTPPQTTDPANFDARADALLGTAPGGLPNLVTELTNWRKANTVAGQINLDAANAASSAAVALASSNFKGAWSSLSGALAVPASVFHANQYWLLLSNLADVTTATPGVSASWAQIPVQATTNNIVNGGFLVNQQGVSGTVVLAAGAYGHDMWKAGASGCTYTFAASGNVVTLTISAGSLIQVIEGSSLFTGTYYLTWTGTATGKIGSGSLASSGITRSVTGGSNTNIEFGTGTLANVSLVPGTVATSVQQRLFPEELQFCRRSYRQFGGHGVFDTMPISGFQTSTTQGFFILPLGEPMRAAPSFSTSAASDWIVHNGSSVIQVATTLTLNDSDTDTVTLIATWPTPAGIAGGSLRLIAANTLNARIKLSANL